MAVHPKHQYNIAVVLLLGVILLFGLLVFPFYSRGGYKQLPMPVKQKMYESDFLEISIKYPRQFTLEERFGVITLKNDDGEIMIGSNGTNHNNLEDYLESLAELNQLTLVDQEVTVINSLEAVKVSLVGSASHEVSYFFYPTDWAVYTISTSSPELYDELDQIAQTFKYTGEESKEN